MITEYTIQYNRRLDVSQRELFTAIKSWTLPGVYSFKTTAEYQGIPFSLTHDVTVMATADATGRLFRGNAYSRPDYSQDLPRDSCSPKRGRLGTRNYTTTKTPQTLDYE